MMHGLQEHPSERNITPASHASASKVLGALKPARSALHLSSNTLTAKPTIIITSGSSAESGLAESKSNTSELLEGCHSAGKESTSRLPSPLVLELMCLIESEDEECIPGLVV